MAGRRATVRRKTGETEVSVELDLDGKGVYQVETGSGMLDHLLAQLSRHSLMDLRVKAIRDPSGWHHVVEDIGITLGRAFREALGEGVGISRMGHALVPLDEALAQVAVDLSGRPYAVVDTALGSEPVEDLPADLVRHLLESFAAEARIALHARVLAGVNSHHKAEALFKALARALRDGVQPDPRRAGDVPSTKGTIGG
ncbi:MAG: imidazoleglycerol-phosphate dehydratase HisB [Chloroflexi bacterium]|nr:imidazoleglycerol-phosphate dehydratase HisB [Chloroflexota bacterium]